ncbi:hypothetical protein [Paenibacillus terrigena]|uniref:hypothetical protein n=1 Tax=Paenibacillus terrigena TaxID=369333 RepID=UPI00037C453B|nr:hypothetical protein [Paenibacillus terrigena]
MAASEAPIRFPCKSCGAQMTFDTESQQMKCGYCGTLTPITHDEEEIYEYELDFLDDSDASRMDWGTEQQVVKCENCSAQMLIPAEQTAGLCAFCGSPKVLTQGDPTGIRPESLMPFHISKDEANIAFLKWKKKKWFVPNAFKKQNTRSNVSGIYIPFWTFDADTESSYSAERGVYHYRTETRTRVVDGKTETYTEQVRYTVWHWTSGDYDRSFDDILIPASHQHDTNLLDRFQDFGLKELIPYQPEYLSGFIAERYTVPLREGWDEAASRMDDQLEREIRDEIGGDEIRNLSISTRTSNETYKHILLPLWNATYTYKKKTFRYMVNGETGKVSGKVPRSGWKITFFTLFCILVALILVAVFAQQAPPA